MNFLSIFQTEATRQGFAASSGVDFDAALEHPIFRDSVRRYQDWVNAGECGNMTYLVRGQSRRQNPIEAYPFAKGVFVVLDSYRRHELGERDPLKGVRYARYLEGPDYHEVMKQRLELVCGEVAKRAPHPFEYRVCVDTSAVLERTWAALCGLGWIGKNTLLIHPRLGSYQFIGVVFVSLPFGRAPAPIPNYCGNCQRCLSGCPTQALSIDRGLATRKCISYYTLEDRRTEVLPEEVAKNLGNWVAGCDLCQEVCPFNQKPVAQAQCQEAQGACSVATWSALETEPEADLLKRLQGSALGRVKPAQFKRNLRWIREGLKSQR